MLKSNKQYKDTKFDIDRLDGEQKAAYIKIMKKKDKGISLPKYERERLNALIAIARGGYKATGAKAELNKLARDLVEYIRKTDEPSILQKDMSLKNL